MTTETRQAWVRDREERMAARRIELDLETGLDLEIAETRRERETLRRCPFGCGYLATDEEDRDRHVNGRCGERHREQAMRECPDCGERFNGAKGLAVHKSHVARRREREAVVTRAPVE